MDTALWVAIVIGLAQIVVQLASTRWQINVARTLVAPQTAKPEGRGMTPPTSLKPNQRVTVEYEGPPVPRWVMRLSIFLVNTVAVYFLYTEYQSTAPVTRAGVVFIASMAGVVCVCFILPLIMAVYDYIISSFQMRGL